jgi:two-component system, OmpR family, phosphate regulon response regulator PhoB
MKEHEMISRILVVDPDIETADTIVGLFSSAGYSCTGCHTAAESLQCVQDVQYDLIISELELPDMSGTELCRSLKYNEGTADIPLVFLSRLAAEVDRVVGLSLGATDYMVKPFSSRELVLRVKAILRRTVRNGADAVVTNGVIRLDMRSFRAWVNSDLLVLTRLEFRLLASLVAAGGHVRKREQIIDDVWGANAHVLDRTVDAHIRTLRKKMGDARDELETVQGVGYRICQHREDDVRPVDSDDSAPRHTTVNDMF